MRGWNNERPVTDMCLTPLFKHRPGGEKKQGRDRGDRTNTGFKTVTNHGAAPFTTTVTPPSYSVSSAGEDTSHDRNRGKKAYFEKMVDPRRFPRPSLLENVTENDKGSGPEQFSYQGKDDEFPEDHPGRSGDENRHMTHTGKEKADHQHPAVRSVRTRRVSVLSVQGSREESGRTCG